MHRRSDFLHVPWVDAGDADAAVLGEEDVVLLRQLLDHGGRHAREAEHANLLRDVRPIKG